MDPRLLEYYNQELQFVREMGAEFARSYPKIAGRLALDEFECADPYVERLLEGFAFLAGRVHLKLDAEFPRLSQHLLETVYPHYLAPTPSMAVVQFRPSADIANLSDGFLLPRDTVLRSRIGKGEQTACEYRTCHDVTLWPVELAQAEYITNVAGLADRDALDRQRAKAGIRLRLRTVGGLKFEQLALNTLRVFLPGRDRSALALYEQVLANGIAVLIRPTGQPAAWQKLMSREHIHRAGFSDKEALIPSVPSSFSGYRLLQEYFSFPQRFMFFELMGLRSILRRCAGEEIEIIVLLNRADPSLEASVDSSDFALYCAPAINLFPKRADRIHVTASDTEFHVIPDRSRPMDFEVVQITDVTGYGTGADAEQEFLPFYARRDEMNQLAHQAYFTVQREPRVVSSTARQRGPRSSYVGSEVFLSLVDAAEAPYSANLKQLSVSTLCSNRDLPLHIPIGAGNSDFDLESGAPVEAVRCVAGPTKPRPSLVHSGGEVTWRLVSHLSLNYLSLLDVNEQQGAVALRDLLKLYGDMSDPATASQIDGVRSVKVRRVTRRMPTPGPITFGRGLEVTLSCDEHAFAGTGAFLFGAVLSEFLRRYVSINSFTEMVIHSTERGEIMRWPAKVGRRAVL